MPDKLMDVVVVRVSRTDVSRSCRNLEAGRQSTTDIALGPNHEWHQNRLYRTVKEVCAVNLHCLCILQVSVTEFGSPSAEF